MFNHGDTKDAEDLKEGTAFPAKAGIHRSSLSGAAQWVPAFAGNAM